MVRHVKKVERKKKKTEWVFKVNVELTYNNKSKIAFLSGLERSYYPEDPGFSKFSIVHGPVADESPPCMYTPPVDRLGKPISLVGYGIGGLSAPRFPKLPMNSEDHPAPDKYQRLLNQQALKNRRRPVPPDQDYYQLPPDDPYVIRKRMEDMGHKLRECKVGFGTMKSTARFGNPPTFSPAGVGSYRPYVQTSSYKSVNASFGRSPIINTPPTEIHCVVDPVMEICVECGRSLIEIDFYRTKLPVRVPLPETRNAGDLGHHFPKGVTRVNLCNVCYFRAMQGSSKNWPKSSVRWLFQKTRTCATIHDHHNVAEFIHKTNCKSIRRLQRKEAVLSKYYPDSVKDSISITEHY